MTPNEREIVRLVSALVDECIEPDQFERLNALLERDAEARRLYLRLMYLHDQLPDAALPDPETVLAEAAARTTHSVRERVQNSMTTDSQSHPGRSGVRSPLAWFAAGAVIAASVAVSIVLLLGPQDAPTNSAAQPVSQDAGFLDQGVAVLTRTVDARWTETGTLLKVGSSLPKGRLRLKAGVAQIEFYRGASVVLEGPAEFELISSDRCVLHSGKLRASVPPPARGFTVVMDDIEVVDFGTVFALQVNDGQNSEVHVIDGEVELRSRRTGSKDLPTRLHTGRSVRFRGNQAMENIVSRPDDFVSAVRLVDLATSQAQRRHERWLKTSQPWREDPATVAYYDFARSDAASRTLFNRGTVQADAINGAVVGCRWAKGRWPGKDALEFKRITDRVRIDVPGTYRSLTLATWLRIEGLERRFNSLLLTDGFEAGEVHWQITGLGQLGFSVCCRRNPKTGRVTVGHDYLSPSLFTPRDLGQWAHLASVYDRDAGLLTHYLNGNAISHEPITEDLPLRIGPAQIGNWNPHDPAGRSFPVETVRSLNGLVDEFLVMGRALGEEQIRRLYDDGKPF